MPCFYDIAAVTQITFSVFLIKSIFVCTVKANNITYPYSVLTFNKPAHSECTLPNDTNNIMILRVEAHLKEEMRTKTISRPVIGQLNQILSCDWLKLTQYPSLPRSH